jgi:hypothetical protein
MSNFSGLPLITKLPTLIELGELFNKNKVLLFALPPDPSQQGDSLLDLLEEAADYGHGTINRILLPYPIEFYGDLRVGIVVYRSHDGNIPVRVGLQPQDFAKEVLAMRNSNKIDDGQLHDIIVTGRNGQRIRRRGTYGGNRVSIA